jgi:hypothetical protein
LLEIAARRVMPPKVEFGRRPPSVGPFAFLRGAAAVLFSSSPLARSLDLLKEWVAREMKPANEKRASLWYGAPPLWDAGTSLHISVIRRPTRPGKAQFISVL